MADFEIPMVEAQWTTHYGPGRTFITYSTFTASRISLCRNLTLSNLVFEPNTPDAVLRVTCGKCLVLWDLWLEKVGSSHVPFEAGWRAFLSAVDCKAILAAP